MWWTEVDGLAAELGCLEPYIAPCATIAPTAVLEGAVRVEAGARICHGAFIQGPVHIGRDCVIGNNALIRGSTRIGNRTVIGFAAEIKNAAIAEDVAIGPQCYVADSKVDAKAYLGAQVRTSNHRLDRNSVSVHVDGEIVDSAREKLGCHIGTGASLGVQVIVLPGRVIAEHAVFEPRTTVSKNLPTGHYRSVQSIEAINKVGSM